MKIISVNISWLQRFVGMKSKRLHSKWFEPRSISSLSSVIVRVSVVLKKNCWWQWLVTSSWFLLEILGSLRFSSEIFGRWPQIFLYKFISGQSSESGRKTPMLAVCRYEFSLRMLKTCEKSGCVDRREISYVHTAAHSLVIAMYKIWPPVRSLLASGTRFSKCNFPAEIN